MEFDYVAEMRALFDRCVQYIHDKQAMYEKWYATAGSMNMMLDVQNVLHDLYDVTPSSISMRHDKHLIQTFSSFIEVASIVLCNGIDIDAIEGLLQELLDLFTRKNADYDFAFEKNGQIGMLTRMSEKLDRIIHVTDSGVMMVTNETVNETLRDFIVYSAMISCYRKKCGIETSMDDR
jgi:hypothetical protein